jgi:DNA repair protein RadC
MSSPDAAGRLAVDLAQRHDDDREHVWLVLVNTRLRYLLHTELSSGTQTSAPVSPKEVFGAALREGATGFLLIHNHTSGDPTPSAEDLRLTRRLEHGARLLDLAFHDHIIVGNGTWRWVSLAAEGHLPCAASSS